MDHKFDTLQTYMCVPVVLDINDPRILIIHFPLPSLLLPVLAEFLCQTQKSSLKT